MTIFDSRSICLACVTFVIGCPAPIDTALDARDAVVDAGTVAVDAGVAAVAVVDAGAATIPVIEQMVDAGHMGDGTDTGAGVPPVVKADKDHMASAITAVHNRLLVKPKDKSLSPAALEKLASTATGKPVERVRRTAGTFFLVQFAPTSPARSRADQQRLITALQKTGAFTVVEGDQLMTIKH
jgi:hypothetical protein